MKRKELLLGIPVAAIAIVCIVCIVCVVCSGCNSFHGRQRATHGGDNSSADTLQGSPRELPLPEVPALLTAPEERAAYVLEHFWDGMDFRDTLRSRDRLFMEQCFVNFLSLFPHALPQSLPSPVGRLLQRAAVDSVAFRLVNSLAEHYLDDPNSHMRNEEHYILFLEALLSLPGLPEAERIRPAYRLETTRKNRPGTIAADFAYTDHRGKRQTLHGTPAPRLLLLFYDPACSHCAEILDALQESPALTRLIAAGELAVLAAYTEGDRRLWDETKAALPQEWTVDEVQVREVQRAVLDAGGYLLPYLDVPKDSPYFKPLQRIGSTGILRGEGRNVDWSNETWIHADFLLRASDLHCLAEYGMNAPDDKALPERTVSIAEAVHIVTGKEMGTVWEQVEAIVHKYAWSDCDTQRPILRKEFAVLADELCNPFARAVNIKGESD